MSFLEEISSLIIAGKPKSVAKAVESALENGTDSSLILSTMINAMGIVGDHFKSGEIFVPEMMVSAKAMKKGMDVLKTQTDSDHRTPLGKVIIGTVNGDLHDVGKNLVIMMIEAAGFEVIDLGVDVVKERFLSTYEENPDACIIALSALLTTTLPSMRETVSLINEQPWRSKIKIMVGGAPVTQEFADEIGADAYTPDAATCAQIARTLVN